MMHNQITRLDANRDLISQILRSVVGDCLRKTDHPRIAM